MERASPTLRRPKTQGQVSKCAGPSSPRRHVRLRQARLATSREYLLSSRCRVRVAGGAQVRAVIMPAAAASAATVPRRWSPSRYFGGGECRHDVAGQRRPGHAGTTGPVISPAGIRIVRWPLCSAGCRRSPRSPCVPRAGQWAMPDRDVGKPAPAVSLWRPGPVDLTDLSAIPFLAELSSPGLRHEQLPGIRA